MEDPVVWSRYPSWRQFGWLCLMSALMGWRAWLFQRSELPGWEAWSAGALGLLVLAVALRRWARYEATPNRLIVRNGYTGRVIAQRTLTRGDRTEIRQGPVARLLGIGTLLVKSAGETRLRLRGLAHPEEAKQRLELLIAARGVRPADAEPWQERAA